MSTSEEPEEIQTRDLIQSMESLDLNEHRQGTIPYAHRFSINKVREGIQNIDPMEWMNKIELPKQDYFSYPASMELAELHQQSCYLQPEKSYLEKTDAVECLCCNRQLNRENINVWTYDVYKVFAKQYGITLPLYFTFLKLHLLIMVLQFITFGLFSVLQSKHFCLINPDLQCHDTLQDKCNACEFVGLYGFIDLDNFRDKIRLDHFQSMIYQMLAFLVFLANLLVPLIHEVIIMHTRIKYWDWETSNHVNDFRCSVYVKHLPHKMTKQEVQSTIQRALKLDVKTSIASTNLFADDANAISELVYIYDIHEIKQMNDKRVELFGHILLIGQQLKELKTDGEIKSLTLTQRNNKKLRLTVEGLEGEFKSKIQELMFETTRIKQYLKQGLPFTNKVILKFRTKQQRDAVYMHYKKSKWEYLKIRIKVLKRQVQEIKLRKKVKDYEIESDESSRTGSFIKQSLLNDDNNDADLMYKNENDSSALNLDPTSLQLLQNNYENDHHDHQELRIYRGFPATEIYWENIGMNTLTRFLLRLRSLVITMITCSIMMGLFELMFVYQNNPDFKLQKSQGNLTFFQEFCADIFTIMVTVVSSISTIILLGQTFKSRRSTYTQEERNVVSFQLFIQLILITAFPFIMSFEFWNAKRSLVPIYDLISLAKNRMIFKCVFQTFHLRNVGFWCRKRKIVKNFSPNLYFQGQLNALLTPPYFPQRGRLLAMFFIYTTGVTMLFICPMIMVFSIVADTFLYFHDKRKTLQTFQVDPKFNIKHMQYLVFVQSTSMYIISSYQMIVAPINIYLYLRLFWWSQICVYVGSSLAIIVIFIYTFFREPLVNFIVTKIIRPQHQRQPRSFEPKTYMQSYDEYFQGLRIESLTTLLSSLFKKVQNQRESVKEEQEEVSTT